MKLRPGGTVTTFAANLDSPRGLAFDRRGHLYVADGSAGRILRFAAPPPPRLAALPPFTTEPSITLSGATLPQARVDAFLDSGVVPPSVTSSVAGTFSVDVPLVANVDNRLDVFITAIGGSGLSSEPVEIDIRHDAVAPEIVIQAPPAGAFVRGTVPVRVDGADRGSELASLTVSAAGRALDGTITPPLPLPAARVTASWDTGSAPDGTQSLTATATDRAGNSATSSRIVIVDNTSPETEITGGPGGALAAQSATLTFRGTDNLTPTTSLQFAWRLDDGPPSAYSTDTTVTLTTLAPGRHLFEVRARDLAGNEDATPAQWTFNVGGPSVSISITAPASGAVVPANLVLVSGTVEAGDEVGVSVNGRPALVHGGQWAVEIPTAAGDQLITAVARLTSGEEGTASVSVIGTDAVPVVALRAEPSSGVAPLQVTWRLASRAPRPLVRFELDSLGDGVFTTPGPALDGTQSTYLSAGLRLPTVRATDDHGTVYVATTIVQVDEPRAALARFQSLWASFRARLQAGDQAGALTHLSPALRSRFETILQRLAPDLPTIAAALGPIHLIDQVDNLAEAALVQTESGAPMLHFIYFRRDHRGQWLIQDM